MYLNYFGFSDAPFENNLDQRFLYLSANHKEITAALRYFIKWKKGFALVCGDVGTGKTMLINNLLDNLPHFVHPIMVANPDVGYNEILKYVAGILKIDAKVDNILNLVDHVKAALVEAGHRGERFVLIIDEAHLLSDNSIEQIRLLSNIETQTHKLFQILLLGQYELSYKLNRPEMRQIRQRININRFLTHMDPIETLQYIDHRIKVAGSSFDACFESNCSHLIFKMTNGVPRSINQLCDSALLVCMAEKQRKVNKTILKKAYTAIRSDILFTPKYPGGGPAAFFSKMVRPSCAFPLILLLVGISVYWGRLGERAEYFLLRCYPTVSTPSSAVQQPISGISANPGIPPSTMKDMAMNSAELPVPSIDKTSKEPISAPLPLPSGDISNEENHGIHFIINEDPKHVFPSNIVKSKIQSSDEQQPGIVGQQSSSELKSPEIKQTTQPDEHASIGEKNGKVLILPLLSEKVSNMGINHRFYIHSRD